MWGCWGLCGNPFLVILVGTSNVYHAGRLLKESQGITMDNQLRTTHHSSQLLHSLFGDLGTKRHFLPRHSELVTPFLPLLAPHCDRLAHFPPISQHAVPPRANGFSWWETGWGSHQGGVTVGNYGTSFGCTWSWRHNFLYHLSDGFFLDQ